jgi:adenylylsulfate kinase
VRYGALPPDANHPYGHHTAEYFSVVLEGVLIVIAAFISPYRQDREAARAIIGEQRFVETYVMADLATCEKRDPRGLYAKARAGDLAEFTGISAPYEPPENPALTLDTASRSADHCVRDVLDFLSSRLR